MEPYYYSRMNKTYQSACHAMKTGLMELRPSFPVPLLEGREPAKESQSSRRIREALLNRVSYGK